MKKHLCRALLALTLALAVTGTTLPTAWAAESEENAPLDCASALLMDCLLYTSPSPRDTR